MKNKLVAFIIIIGLVFSETACTVLGALIGNAVDDTEYTKVDKEVMGLSHGQSVEIINQNNALLKGEFIKFRNLAEPEYSLLYGQFLSEQNKKAPIPVFNKNYFVNAHEGAIKFKGFDFGSVIYDSSENRNKSMPLEQIYFLKDSAGVKVTKESLYYLLLKKPTPLYSQILLDNDGKTFEVNSGDISNLCLVNKYGMIYGALIGAVVDAVVIIVGMSKVSFWGASKIK